MTADLDQSTPHAAKQQAKGPMQYAGVAPIRCRGCQHDNTPQRRFCSECGTSLFDRCPKCAAEMVASERFCGECGVNVQETIRQQEAELEQRLQQAQALQQSHRFDEAEAILRSLAGLQDAHFDKFKRQAADVLVEFADQRRQFAGDVESHIEKARQYLAAYAYDKGLEVLQPLPESLHTPAVKQLLATLREKQTDTTQLLAEIREGLASNRKLQLLPKIERLLALKPDHAQAKELAKQLRDQICVAARKQAASHKYEEARTLLESLPAFVRTEETEKLLDGVLEVDSLATDVQLSPLADEALESLAQRLVKLAPKDAAAVKQLAEIQARRKAQPADARVPFPAWSAAPQRPLLGMPVDRLGHFSRCNYSSHQLNTQLREQPGQFYVALGLALQAREQAAVSLNLLPAETGGLLGKFAISLRKPQPKGGWGIDLSRTGLRAIRLGPDLTNGRVRIEAVVSIPHARPLGQPGEQVPDVDLIAATLRTFRERHPIAKEKEKRDPVFIGLSGSRILGRFFDLPPSPAKKLAELVQYEAKHQVPFPLQDLSWGYQVLEEAANKPDENSRHMLLLAAKEFHVAERVNAFKNAELPVDGITAEPLALHNAFAYEMFSGEASSQPMAVLDIGTHGSSLIVSSPKRVWFRTSSCGGDDFTAALVQQLHLTGSAAEEVKRAPHKARRFHLWRAAMQPLFVKHASEIERSLAAYTKQFTESRIERLYLAGGGAATHGWLRYLMHGR